MPKMNHEKLNQKRRAIKSMESNIVIQRRSQAWRKIGFGKHAEKTAPELIRADPSYFYWLCGQQWLHPSLAEQLRQVAKRQSP